MDESEVLIDYHHILINLIRSGSCFQIILFNNTETERDFILYYNIPNKKIYNNNLNSY